MKKWKLLESKPIYESKWLSLYNNEYKLPNGVIKSDYLHLKRGNYVLILAINKKKEIIIERQYRRGLNEFNYELPAGWVDSNENVLDTAKRELKEETGYICNPIKSFEFFPQPAFMEMRGYVVICELTNNSTSKDLSDDENIEFKMVSISKVKEMIKSGKIKDMGLITAIGVYESINI